MDAQQQAFLYTALFFAAENGHLSVVNLLLQRRYSSRTWLVNIVACFSRANLHHTDKYGNAAAHYAARNLQLETLTCLVTHRANVETKDSEKLTLSDYGKMNAQLQSAIDAGLREIERRKQSMAKLVCRLFSRLPDDTACLVSSFLA